jgi:prolycopene isomerase
VTLDMAQPTDFDAIIIGAGLGGLSCGAILAQKEGKRVLVLERQPTPGGRIHHYKGSDIRTREDYLRPLQVANGQLTHSIPDLDTIIDQKLLHGYGFELGMHDIVNGAHSRMCHILEFLDVPVEIVPLKACGFWHDDQLYRLKRGQLPWMDLQTYTEMKRLLAEMLRMPLEQVRENHRISLREYLDARTTDAEVLDFFDILGGFTVGMNSARELSAGEFILATRMPMAAGLHFADGTLGQMGGESFMQMAHNLIKIIEDGGGELRVNTAADTVLIEDGVARGIQLADGTEITAPVVVSNVPAKFAIRSLIPNEHLPTELIDRIAGWESGGAYTPIFGLSQSVIDIPGMLFSKIPVDDPDFPDGILLGYEAHSLFVENKAPDGKEIIDCWVGLATSQLREVREKNKFPVLAEALLDFFRTKHPGFDDALEWALFPAFDSVTSVSPTPAQAWDAMLDPACPGIEGLYFVGDSVKNYGGFMDGVAYGALLCADAVTGKNYLEQVLPAYQREI